MLDWEKLLSHRRRKDLRKRPELLNTATGREEIERDYDRILFATPTRRLADKTQVFPMEENDAIRTRLTHSLEVSNLARSIGVQLAFPHAKDVFGEQHEQLNVKRVIPALLAAVGLAHDLGNPPFGHQGEVAIREWFKDRFNWGDIDQHQDFVHFDGNAQTFRLLTRLQVLNDDLGLNLTCATLAALVKYPSLHDSDDKGGFTKFGIFESEKNVIQEVWEQTGLGEGIRHPLAYVMEACDDIAYSVIDAEDIVKKGYASFYDLIDHLDSKSTDDKVIEDVLIDSKKTNARFKKNELSSRELNDVSMIMFRVKAISVMIESAIDVFRDKITVILNNDIPQGYSLMENSVSAVLCSELKEFDRKHGFLHSDVLKLELEGNNYIRGMMDLLWSSINKPNSERNAFERYAYGSISENYRRVFEDSRRGSYDKMHLLSDAVSGMTEKHLIEVYRELRSLADGPS